MVLVDKPCQERGSMFVLTASFTNLYNRELGTQRIQQRDHPAVGWDHAASWPLLDGMIGLLRVKQVSS